MVGRSVLVYGAIFMLAADFCYRMKTPRAVHVSIGGSVRGDPVPDLPLGALGRRREHRWARVLRPAAAGQRDGRDRVAAARERRSGRLPASGASPISSRAFFRGMRLRAPAKDSDVQTARLFALWSAGAIGLALGSQSALRGARASASARPLRGGRPRRRCERGVWCRDARRERSDGDPLRRHAAARARERQLLPPDAARPPGASAGRSLFNLLRFANRERMQAMLEQETAA